MLTDTKIKEIPMLFSTPMVQALLNGTKTETRRLFKINGQPITSDKEEIIELRDNELKEDGTVNYLSTGGLSGPYKCPWRIGNILWVKETHCFLDEKDCEGRKTRDYYRTEHHESNNEWFKENYKWTPSLFMRRHTARIFLRIESIGIERLRDITEEEAMAEGILKEEQVVGDLPGYKNYHKVKGKSDSMGDWYYNPIDSYKSLWESINGAGSWGANPWVWVVKFKKIDKYGKV